NFALAHARLSTVYLNLGEQSASRDEIITAYAMRDRVSEPERLYITARYATIVEGSVQKSIETYQIWTQTYPSDFVPHSNLAVAFEQRGDHEKAIEEYHTAIRLAPDEPLPYGNLAGIYSTLGRGDEARKTVEDAIGRGLDSIGFRGLLYTLAFFRKDEAEMARQAVAAQRLSEGFQMLLTQASVAISEGKIGRAHDLCEQYTSEVALRTGLRGSAAGAWGDFAQSAAMFGDAAAARAAVRRTLELDRGIRALLGTAYALILVRDVAEGERLIAEAAKVTGGNTPDAQSGLALLGALVKSRKGDRTALENLPMPKSDTDFITMSVIGVLNLETGSAEIAAERFKQIVDRRALFPSPLRTVAPLFYGRALAKLSRIDESRKAYEQFFSEMKSADPGLPIVTAAKAEYARLKNAS
ncbi:MAG TPA: tetratricopeptide repeat protein, partial [Vicinamibacterales bacterium]|nr:tetratricopeptide repeat protein [Vicinamibacterales bacterium]